jgi:hypothetical protein
MQNRRHSFRAKKYSEELNRIGALIAPAMPFRARLKKGLARLKDATFALEKLHREFTLKDI